MSLTPVEGEDLHKQTTQSGTWPPAGTRVVDKTFQTLWSLIYSWTETFLVENSLGKL